MNAFKTVAVALGITLAAVILIPPTGALAGLFVWLKVTEEADEEILELDREGLIDLQRLAGRWLPPIRSGTPADGLGGVAA